MAETWTIQRVLLWTTDFFRRKRVDSPRLAAELLLGHVLGCDRVRLYVDFERPLNADELARLRSLIERRVAGESVWYLLGAREFFGRSFKVDARVLVPRPETELLVEEALKLLPAGSPGRVLDLCTGSGCIGITLAAERPQARVVATDISSEALQVARENAQALGVAERVSLVRGDLDEPVAGQRFATVVSNPPYVRSGVIGSLAPEVRSEPRGALDGGPDGLVILRRIAARAPALLEPGGALLVEIGEEQGAAVTALMQQAGLVDARVLKDLAKLDRIAVGRMPDRARA